MACMAAAVLALGMSTMALAAEPAANTITVNGQGILKVAPDVATIHVTVEKTAKTAAQAQKDVNEELTDVIAAMKALGVTDEDIVTSHISVYPSYRYDEKTDKQVLENYQAYTSVNVTTNDVDNAGKYVDAALNAGATGTNGVTFSLEKPETYYNQALTEAVKAAQSSATAIAQAYGKPLGQVPQGRAQLPVRAAVLGDDDGGQLGIGVGDFHRVLELFVIDEHQSSPPAST